MDCNQKNVEIEIGHIFSYADTKSNRRENLVPICGNCNEGARADNNSNQIAHQNKNNKLADVKITDHMLGNFPDTFKKFYNNWRSKYDLPEL